MSTLRTGVRGNCTDLASCWGVGAGLGLELESGRLVWEVGLEMYRRASERLGLHQIWGRIGRLECASGKAFWSFPQGKSSI